jgi:integrase
MNYLMKRGDRYYFNRKVPHELKQFDPRRLVRVSLKTDSRKEAIRLMVTHNEQLENYWKNLVRNNRRYEAAAFERLVTSARLLGFSYVPNIQIADYPLPDIIRRVEAISGKTGNEKLVSAVLGGVEEPKLKLSDVFEKFLQYSTARTMNKSANQVRKWLNPRKLAMKNFIECIGDKDFAAINRDDILNFRKWWIERVEGGDTIATTANKNLINVKNIIETINDNLNAKLDTQHLFKKLLLPPADESRRLPFESEYIVSTLLNPENLKGLNEQAKWVLHAIAETGAGISEQVGLLPEDIRLDCEIPHIIIQPRHKKALKTKYRQRKIPLVGYALEAFKACPNGFTDYRDKPDTLSATLSKYLKENKLLPSPDHTVYSLRHSFQDRLLAVNAPDRLQADLMGHKFNRPAYGDGASLVQKQEYLKLISLKK